MKESILAKILAAIISMLLSMGVGSIQELVAYCDTETSNYLGSLEGTWQVETRDRITPGEYEQNKGVSRITGVLKGCGIQESYSGTFRAKEYEREVLFVTNDSSHVKVMAIDSEHGSFSSYKGLVKNEILTVIWYRDEKVKRLQSKYVLTKQSENDFEFSSFLSTDYGETWALTHERKYRRSGF
ncbi:MAG: hypothetical protein ACMZ7B_05290 [Balneola sp.]